jgi:hypothetical protein
MRGLSLTALWSRFKELIAKDQPIAPGEPLMQRIARLPK